MTEQSDILQQLTSVLSQQKVRLEQVLVTLDKELEAIRQRSGDALIEISQQKEAQLAEIRSADAAINNDTCIELIKSTPELTQLQQEVVAIVEQCQQKNEVCYLTATQNQIAVEQVKNLLVGGSKNTTYNEQGQKNTYGSLGRGIKA